MACSERAPRAGVGTHLARARLAAARRRERLDDFGDTDFEEPLVILGLPRTGTTHLHNLLGQHPSLRSLPFRESLDPIPAKAVRDGRAPDLRRKRCEQALRLQRWVMPRFEAMHEMTPDAPHEEIQLLALAFRTMYFDASAHVPGYGAWYRSHDQSGAYRYLKRLLQALQWLRGPSSELRSAAPRCARPPRACRWVLESPRHLDQIGPLLAAFPDARIVHTHRDPARVIASICTMLAYGLRVHSARIDPLAVGRIWGERIAAMLDASLRVCAFAGLDADASVRRRFEAYQAANPRGRHGTIEYRLADFGLDAAALRARLAPYVQRFGVTEEVDTRGLTPS